MIGKVINYTNQQQVSFTSVTTNTCPQRLLFGSNLWFGERQSTITMVFSHWPREDSFLLSRALGGTCQRLSCLCNILLQDLTPLRVKITRGTYLLSVCRRKLKLTTYWHTVSYNYISFLNKSSQLVWVLGTAGSSRFYSITWRMISRNSFSKTASVRRKLFSLVSVILFLSSSFYSLQIVHGSCMFIQSSK